MRISRAVPAISVAALLATLGACSKGGSGSGNSGGNAAGQSGGGESGQTGGGAGIGGEAAGGSAQPGSGGSGAGGNAQAGGGSAMGGAAAGGSSGTGGSANGGNPGTAGTVPCAQRPYCNDFEAIAVGQRPAGNYNVSGGNILRVASDKAVSGTKSLYIKASSGTASYSVLLAGKLVNPKRIAYVRIKLWVGSLPTGPGSAHWDLIGVSGNATTDMGSSYNVSVNFGGVGDPNSNSRLIYLGGGADCEYSARMQFLPLQKWTCVEYKVDETDPNGTPYGISIDGKVIPEMSLKTFDNGAGCAAVGAPFGTWYVPKVNIATIGFEFYHTQTRAAEFWIDDVIVDEKPIGCN